VSILAGLATANPIEVRQLIGGTGTTSNEFSQGGCRDILFAWARGSTEIGNMVHTSQTLWSHTTSPFDTQLTHPQGTIVGPPTSDGLKRAFGRTAVATEGIDYAALISTNALPGGTDARSTSLMTDTLTSMASQCPDSVIVAGGYSQGAAVNHRAIESLPASVQEQIAGVVLYGDTQKQQDNDQIPNFPKEKVSIICQTGDAVCRGTLAVLPAHLTYGARADEGVEFLTTQIRGAQAKIRARNAKREVEEKVKRVAKEIVA
jgi:cutinase